MLHDADYLRITKGRTTCVECGKNLIESEKHPSVLLDAEGAGEWRQQHARAEDETGDAETEAKKTDSKTEDKDAKKEEDDAFVRLDYCPDCWKDLKERAFFSFWISKRTPSDQPKRKLNRAERNLALLALFDTLGERENEETDFAPHLFFLAHLLMKFKIFKWVPGENDPDTGEPMLLFERADEEERVNIPDMDMPPEMIVRIKEEVEAYLEESTGQEVKL